MLFNYSSSSHYVPFFLFTCVYFSSSHLVETATQMGRAKGSKSSQDQIQRAASLGKVDEGRENEKNTNASKATSIFGSRNETSELVYNEEAERDSEVSEGKTMSIDSSGSDGGMPPAVTNLLRYGKTRGINTTMWFTPPEGWGNESGKAGKDTASGSKVVDGAFFIEKLTHLGLGLAVGRPLQEQLLIEEALSSHNLEEAVKVASSVYARTTSGLEPRLVQTERNATRRNHHVTNSLNVDMDELSCTMSELGQQPAGCVDIDWLVSTLGLSYEQCSSSPSSKHSGDNELDEGLTARAQTYAHKKVFTHGNSGHRTSTKESTDHSRKQDSAALVPLVEKSWKTIESQVEAKLKQMCRFHHDKFYKLRVCCWCIFFFATTV
jgi:hypothetical protein